MRDTSNRAGPAPGLRVLIPGLLALLCAMCSVRVSVAQPSGDDPSEPIRFNFKNAPFDQVIDFFSRATGLPVVKEADVPSGTLDYLSPETYDRDEGLEILNRILQGRGVHLDVSDDMLYLRNLKDIQRASLDTYVGEFPAEVGSHEVVTFVKPLTVAVASSLAERLAPLVSSFGSVTAMQQQNSLVIVDTAMQIRRLLSIINELDREDPEGVIKLFRLQYTQAKDIMVPLKALLAVKVQKFVVDPKSGKQTKIEEESMPGLNITADERTNTIIAKGLQMRIDKLEETIALLDVAESSASRTVRTFVLAVLSPNDAAKQLNQMFAKLPEPDRPVILPMAHQSRVAVIGGVTEVSEAEAMLAAIDGGAGERTDDAQAVKAIVLKNAEPRSLIGAIEKLLTPRQKALVKVVASPDGRSILLSGPAGDVSGIESLIPVLDTTSQGGRQVRLLRLPADNAGQVIDEAQALFDRQREQVGGTRDLSLEFDADSHMLTMIGSRIALDEFAHVLRIVETNQVVDQETRQLVISNATPSSIVASVQALSKQLLAPRDGGRYVQPTIDAVDALDLLIVTATPEQFGVIESLVQTLDRPRPGDFQFRVVSLSGLSDASALLERARTIYERLALGYDPTDAPLPQVEVDSRTGNLLMSGSATSVRLYEQALAEARRLLPPARTGRMYTLRNARAGDIVEPLLELLQKSVDADGLRTVPLPSIETIRRTNSLYVLAEPAQHSVVDRYVRQLDTFEPTELPPMRLLQVRAADAVKLSQMIRRRYDARPSELRRDKPVTIDADAATNTLIIEAHTDLFDEIREFVESVNRSGEDQAERETMLFPLKLARASDLANALDKLYPQPPMPLDRRGNPMPHLQEPKEVHVSAEEVTNTLIIEAPVDRRKSFEALVEELDRVELPPTAQLRTYHIENGDPQQIVRQLTDLAKRGVMSKQPDDGSKPVDVSFQAESLSRTLIVAGDEVTFAKTEEILHDLQAVPVDRSLRVFEVTGADPDELSQRAKTLYAEQTAGMPDAKPVHVEVDRETSTMWVVAEDEAMFRFASILNQLQDTIGPPPQVNLVPLEYADAADVVTFLSDLATGEIANISEQRGPPPIFQAIERTNSVLIAAMPEQHPIIRALIESLDQPESHDMPPLRILKLRTADARNLSDALMREYNRRPLDERNAKPVSLSADSLTNTIIVAAHPDVLPEIQSIVDELNRVGDVDYEGREIRIFPLKVARAEELARTIDEMFPEPPVPVDNRGRPLPHLKQPREVVVRADAQTNSLIVDAPIQRMAGFDTLVENLDRQKMVDESEVRTYPVLHAELEDLARTLSQLAQAGSLSPAGRDRRVPIIVSAERTSKTLIVSGPTDIFERVEQVLSELDVKRSGPATSLRFFKLAHARADSIAPMLREVLIARIDEDVPDAGSDADVMLNVSVDRKTNTLIISAPEALMPVAQELIDQLDDSTASIGEPTIRVRPLTFADASEMTRSLMQALPQMISKATGEPMDVRMIASPGSNAVILVGLEKDLSEVEQLIEPLDARPTMDAIDAQTFALEYADATTIAPVVENLLTDQMETDPRIIMERIRRSRGELAFAPKIRVEADERTNSLIVSGPQRTVALAQTLIEQLDRADEAGQKTYATYTPHNADPSILVSTVERVLDATRPAGRRSTVELVLEQSSGAVIIIGSEEETQEAMKLLVQRDNETSAQPQMDLKIRSLQYADAGVVAQAVTPMLRDQARWPQSLRAAARAGVSFAQPTVTADSVGNRVLISAPTPLMAVANSLIDELDQSRQTSGAVDVRVFGLTQAKANDVSRAISQAMTARKTQLPGSPDVNVSAEASSNSLIVTASPEQLAEIEAIVNSLDSGVAADAAQVRTVFLEHARAEHVAPIVEGLLAQESLLSINDLPNWARVDFARQMSDQNDPTRNIRIVADSRLNAVIVAGPAARLNAAEQMIRQLDINPGAVQTASQRSVRVLVIDNADAVELSDTLTAVFEESDQAQAPPTIRVDASSNSLIVRATQSQFTTIESIVSKIDAATIATTRHMQLIPIDTGKASAADVAQTLQRLLGRDREGRVEIISLDELIERTEGSDHSDAEGTSSRRPVSLPEFVVMSVVAAIDAPNESGVPQITIAVDEASNSLIVIGSSRAIERTLQLAEQVQDFIPAPADRVRYISLPDELDSNSLQRLVNSTLRSMTPAGGRRGDLGRSVSVLSDDTSNALIVVCSDQAFESVGPLIAALSKPGTAEQRIVKVYPLRNVTADRAASSVQQLITPDIDPRSRRPRNRQVQRMREVALTLIADDQSIDAVFDPNRMNVTSDAQTNALIVSGPPESIQFVDQFVQLLDQEPVSVQATLKLYPLQQADASELQQTLGDVFKARHRSQRNQLGPAAIDPEFAADDRTNTLLVTASPEHLKEIDVLLADLDRTLGEDRHPLHIIELKIAQPNDAADILKQVVVGSDQKRNAETLIVANNPSGVLLVRAAEDIMAEIGSVLAEIDRTATKDFEIRTITLERADASVVADAVQRFFDDVARIASGGGRRSQSRRVSVVGDTNSNTLLVAASNEDFEEIAQLVEQFDSIEATGALEIRVFQLEHARATEIEDTVRSLVDDLIWNQPFIWNRRSDSRNDRQSLAVRSEPRLNALIVTGKGERFDIVEQIIKILDAPQAAGEQRVVKLYTAPGGDADTIADIIRELHTDTNRSRRWWEPPDPTELAVRVDDRTGTLIVSGTMKEHEEIEALITSLEGQLASGEQSLEVVPVSFARARDLARTLEQFLDDRARASGEPTPPVAITSSDSSNALVIAADEESLAMIRDLVARLDLPDTAGDRKIEIVALTSTDANANEIARLIGEQFRGAGGQGVRISADNRTNSLILNAPQEQFEQAMALIERLDTATASDETIIRTYSLTGARAADAVRILSDTLQLDSSGETKGISIKLEEADAQAVEVRARVVADTRSNSLVVTATEESFPVIESLITRLDQVPAVSPIEYRIIPLEHALAVDVAFTLDRFFRQRIGDDSQPKIDYHRIENELIIAASADQFEQIEKIISEIDKPTDSQRITDFLPLKYAEAEKVQQALSWFYGPLAVEAETPGQLNVRIVAVPASNSLVITADESEWQGIRELLAKLDNEEYDSSLQLRVIPLTYADARSVARAINEAFQDTQRGRDQDNTERNQRRPTDNIDENRRNLDGPTVLVKTEDWVRASAEPQTNSVVVSANRQNIEKIERIVEQLDVADYAKLPPPRLIPVTTGNPQQLAESVKQLFEQAEDTKSRTGVRIVGDVSSNTLIVRAEDEEFEQISTLVDALQQEAIAQGLSVHVLKLKSAPAARIASAVTEAFQAKASQTNQPLSIRVHAAGNSLIIASSGPMFEEIADTVSQLDALAPAAGQAIFIIELEHVSPEAARSVIQTIGLDKDQPEDSISRIVTEPIKISFLAGRNAIVVVANPADRDTVVGLLKSIDTEPKLAEAHTRIVKLRNAQASALAQVINQVLTPAQQQTQTPLARAVQEQVRRLSVVRDGLDDEPLSLDLTTPIRVIPDESLNALLFSSTKANVDALAELVTTFDELPITEAVTVQLFPLENIAAADFRRIVTDIFSQGKQLNKVPGSSVTGVPGGMVGKALLDEIAISVDERTNTIVVAGKEDAVAFVEVMTQRLDSDVATGWIEPRIITLRYADADELAETLNAILVEGARDLPQSTPFQRQIARLRVARVKGNGGRVLESEVFSPMTRLVIRPEPQIDAIILVGTPINIEVVSELIAMLDIEEASPEATVRIYPIEHASAARVGTILTGLFDQQIRSGAIREEDRVIAQADERTNALIVTTSSRSFAVLERLLESLDSEMSAELNEIRRIALKNASASRIAGLIQQLMDARLERLRRVQPETADLEKATIIAEVRTNSLVVAAGNESFEVIAQLASELDGDTLADISLMHVISLEKGNVDRIAQAINSIMERRYAEMPAELSRSQKPLVLTDPRSSSLLVAANPEDLNAIQDLVTKLEAAPMNPAIGIHVVALDTLQAEELAPRLEQLMRERQQSLGEASTPSDRVSVEPDPVSNSLIVAANDENLEVINSLIHALSHAESAIMDGQVEVLSLTASRADDIVDLLNEMFVEEENRRRGGDAIRVTADERLNAVLVNALPEDARRIRDLVAQLDGAKPAQIVEIKYVPLKSANALETVSLIENVLNGRNIAGRRVADQAIVLKYFRELAGEDMREGVDQNQMEVSSAIRQSINLTPDLRTNTVIVSAPKDAMVVIERMISDLDSSSTGSRNIRIFKLTNADAVAMQDILIELFNLRQGSTINVLKPREATDLGDDEDLLQGFGGLAGIDLTTVPDERQQLSITIDARTNSLLVSGTPTYLDLVESVVTTLDTVEANEREVFVYPLRNAVAEEVARVIGDFVQQEQEKLIGTLSVDQLGSAARLLEREVTIQGDTKSNTVLVSASPRYMERVQEMIRQLDVDPPQVLIQVLLAEITLDGRDEWGVDLNLAADTTSPRSSIASGFGLASTFISSTGAPFLSITGTDVDLLIRALRAQGRLQVLSNPSIMAANNEPARIQVGETIRVPSSTSFDQGSQSTSVEPEEVGVIVDVTPSINPDGFVRLDIEPQISELSERTTQISEDFESPIITRRIAETTVTVKDGQTVVIGGLISDRFERREEKVPFFGDIPFVGKMFRAELETTAKTEFLIVLTPHVSTSPAEMHELTVGEMKRLNFEGDMKNMIRDQMNGYDVILDPLEQQRFEEFLRREEEFDVDGGEE